MHLKKITKL